MNQQVLVEIEQIFIELHKIYARINSAIIREVLLVKRETLLPWIAVFIIGLPVLVWILVTLVN